MNFTIRVPVRKFSWVMLGNGYGGDCLMIALNECLLAIGYNVDTAYKIVHATFNLNQPKEYWIYNNLSNMYWSLYPIVNNYKLPIIVEFDGDFYDTTCDYDEFEHPKAIFDCKGIGNCEFRPLPFKDHCNRIYEQLKDYDCGIVEITPPYGLLPGHAFTVSRQGSQLLVHDYPAILKDVADWYIKGLMFLKGIHNDLPN